MSPAATGPTMTLAVVASLLFGAAIGLGVFVFAYAEGASYLTDDPEACANCHIMQDQYDGWIKSTHHAVAVCNDCHAPQGFFDRYRVKAINGFWHSYAFTTGDFHEPIRIKRGNLAVTEAQCRRCHGELTSMIEHVPAEGDRGPMQCTRCHGAVGHPKLD